MQNEPWYSTGWAFTPQKFTVRTTAQSHSHSSTYYTVYTELGWYTAASNGIGLKHMWNLSKEHLIQSKPLKRGWCFCKVKAAVVHRGTVRVITHSKNHICQPVSLYTQVFWCVSRQMDRIWTSNPDIKPKALTTRTQTFKQSTVSRSCVFPASTTVLVFSVTQFQTCNILSLKKGLEKN